jgi:hypothetical protein
MTVIDFALAVPAEQVPATLAIAASILRREPRPAIDDEALILLVLQARDQRLARFRLFVDVLEVPAQKQVIDQRRKRGSAVLWQ